jgi:GTP-dependent dephospho-CoA kinase
LIAILAISLIKCNPIMPLNDELISILKKPLGDFIPDNEVTKQKILTYVKEASLVAAVGDATTFKLLSFDLIPEISILDGKERRSKVEDPYVPKNGRSFDEQGIATIEELKCTNPPSTISKDAYTVLKFVIERKRFPVRIFVEGEEDLLTLPMVTMSPDGAIVLYGQPLEGIVIIKVTETIRKKAKSLMDSIDAH